MKIRNIVFDMGEVLIRFTPSEFIRRLGIEGEDAALLRKEVFGRVEWVQFDRGTLNEEQTAASVCERLPVRLHEAARELVFHWWSRPLIPIDGMEELMGELKGLGYGIYLLSNANRRLREYLPRIPGSQYLDGLVVSAEELLLKPQREIYQVLYDRYGLKPEECYFIDDSPLNVEGALCTGMRGSVFDGDVERLRRELRAAGIPVRDASAAAVSGGDARTAGPLAAEIDAEIETETGTRWEKREKGI